MTEKEKMLAGKIYDPSDKELVELRTKAHRLSKEYNELLETDERRAKIIKELGIKRVILNGVLRKPSGMTENTV